MRRLTPLLLLLLVLAPLTMAPRTSLTPDEAELTISGSVARGDVPVGGPINVMLQARNATSHDLLSATLFVELQWSEEKDDPILWAALSPACSRPDGDFPLTVECDLGSLRSGQQKTVALSLRVLDDGLLTIDPRGTGTHSLGTLGVVEVVEPPRVAVGSGPTNGGGRP